MLKQPPNIRAPEGLYVSGKALNKAKHLYAHVENQIHLFPGLRRLDREFVYADYSVKISVMINSIGSFTYGYCNIYSTQYDDLVCDEFDIISGVYDDETLEVHTSYTFEDQLVFKEHIENVEINGSDTVPLMQYIDGKTWCYIKGEVAAWSGGKVFFKGSSYFTEPGAKILDAYVHDEKMYVAYMLEDFIKVMCGDVFPKCERGEVGLLDTLVNVDIYTVATGDVGARPISMGAFSFNVGGFAYIDIDEEVFYFGTEFISIDFNFATNIMTFSYVDNTEPEIPTVSIPGGPGVQRAEKTYYVYNDAVNIISCPPPEGGTIDMDVSAKYTDDFAVALAGAVAYGTILYGWAYDWTGNMSSGLAHGSVRTIVDGVDVQWYQVLEWEKRTPSEWYEPEVCGIQFHPNEDIYDSSNFFKNFNKVTVTDHSSTANDDNLSQEFLSGTSIRPGDIPIGMDRFVDDSAAITKEVQVLPTSATEGEYSAGTQKRTVFTYLINANQPFTSLDDYDTRPASNSFHDPEARRQELIGIFGLPMHITDLSDSQGSYSGAGTESPIFNVNANNLYLGPGFSFSTTPNIYQRRPYITPMHVAGHTGCYVYIEDSPSIDAQIKTVNGFSLVNSFTTNYEGINAPPRPHNLGVQNTPLSISGKSLLEIFYEVQKVEGVSPYYYGNYILDVYGYIRYEHIPTDITPYILQHIQPLMVKK